MCTKIVVESQYCMKKKGGFPPNCLASFIVFKHVSEIHKVAQVGIVAYGIY